MEKEIYSTFNLGAQSGPDVQMDDLDKVQAEEKRLKNNSTAFLITGMLTVAAGAAVLGLSSGLFWGGFAGVLGVTVGVGVAAMLVGKFKFLRNVFGRKTLEFPKLKLQRKSSDESATSSSGAFEETTFASRRLSKSDTNKVFFGVCAGLADYAGASPGLIRMIFALAFFFSGGTIFIPYFLLAIFLPGMRDRV